MAKNFLTLSLIIVSMMESSAHFGYTKRQQHLWHRDFKNCNGKMQSPIAISTSKSIFLPLPALEMNGFHDLLPRLTLTNNGHSVAMHVDSKSKKLRRPHIFGSALKEYHRYEFQGIHFHWGIKNNRGSEHVVNGIRYVFVKNFFDKKIHMYPMEMHIIHRNTLYKELKDALEYEDGLVVLAVFFQLQDNDNDAFNSIIKNFQLVQWKNTTTKMNVSITLHSILPKDTDTYYTYKGSLTTPPCNEAVTWIIFSNPVSISFRQMNKFRSMSNGEDTLADNFRKLQDLGNRKVYFRKITDEFAGNEVFVYFNTSDLEWFWK